MKYFKFLIPLLGLFSLSTGAKAYSIDASQCGAYGTDCVEVGTWPEAGGGSSPAEEAAKIESLFGLTSGSLSLAYKDEQGGGESGGLSGSYSTTYDNTPTDPSEATISYGGGPAVACPECFLFVKDGSASPNAYVFNLGTDINPAALILGIWNGTDVLELTNFWSSPSQGAISHVALYTTSAVPVPAAVWLFGTALLGFIGFSRRTQV